MVHLRKQSYVFGIPSILSRFLGGYLFFFFNNDANYGLGQYEH